METLSLLALLIKIDFNQKIKIKNQSLTHITLPLKTPQKKPLILQGIKRKPCRNIPIRHLTKTNYFGLAFLRTRDGNNSISTKE